MRRHRNIYKSVLDGVIYFILYLCVPLSQCIANLIVDPKLFWFSVFLAVTSLWYDSYTRYNKKSSKNKRNKILWIGVISFVLFIYTFCVIILRENGVEVQRQMQLPYLALVVPFFISLLDCIDIFVKTVSEEVL